MTFRDTSSITTTTTTETSVKDDTNERNGPYILLDPSANHGNSAPVSFLSTISTTSITCTMATEEPAESTGSRELPEYYQNLTPFSIGDSMRDFDNPGTTNELNRLVMNPHSQNFIVDFGDDEAWCGFELTADAYSTLLKARRPPELNTRWINIWTPYQQKDIIETLAAHYDFTPRLRSFMLSKPLDFSTSSSSSGSSKTSFFHRHSRPKTSSALPNSSNEDRHGLGAEKSSPDSSTHASSSHDAENQIGLMNSASPSNYRSMDDLNIYNMANNIWHFQTVDWGRRCKILLCM